MKIDRSAFAEIARGDFEFKRETRYLTGVIRLDFGSTSWALNFTDGALANVADGASVADDMAAIIVGGTDDQWGELLQWKPRPFYQCIQSAAVKHGMRISGSSETFAYLPALNRMTTLLRQMHNEEA